MKLKQYIALCLCLTAVLAAVCACGGNTPADTAEDTAVTTAPADTQKDPMEVCAAILSRVTFYETPEPIDGDMIPVLLGDIFTDKTVYMYAGSRACADTLVAVKLNGSDDAAVIKALENYVQKQRLSFEDYKPAEMTKIENAVLKQGGGLAVLCITDDYGHAATLTEGLLH